MLRQILSVIWMIAVITQAVFLASAQTTENPLQDEVDEAEAKAKIAKAKREELDALFPKPDVSSLVGGTKVNEGTFIETQMLGYCAMKSAAIQIGDQINERYVTRNANGDIISNTKGNLVVYNDADVKMLARYMIMKNHLRNLELSYQPEITAYVTAINTVIPGGYTSAMADGEIAIDSNNERSGIPALVDIALKSLSLLKTDIEITPAEVTIGEKELVAEVFSNLDGFTLYYPQTIPLSIQNCTAVAPATCSPLLDQIKATNDAYSYSLYLKDIKLKKILDDREKVITITNLITNPTTPPGDLPGLNLRKATILANYTSEANLLAIKNRTDPIDNRVKRLNVLFNSAMEELGVAEPSKAGDRTTQPTTCPDNTCSQITTVNVSVGDKEEKKDGGGGGGKTFGSYLQTEKLKEIMDVANSRFVELKVIKAGGNMRVKSNIITNLMIGSRVNFSGGAIVYFNVFNRSGASEKSGVVQIYEPYRKSSRINDRCNTKPKD